MKIILGFSSFSVCVKTNKDLETEYWLKPFLIENKMKRNINLSIILSKTESKVFKTKPNSYACFVSKKDFSWKGLLFLIEKLLYDHLFDFNIFFLHASAVCFNGKTFVFCGKSNSGKTTIARKLNTGNNVINDDHVIIHKKQKGYYVSSFPLNNNKDLINNLFERIHKFFLIEKSNKNEICPIKRSEAIDLLQANIYPPDRSEKYTLIAKNFFREQEIHLLRHFVGNYREFKQVLMG